LSKKLNAIKSLERMVKENLDDFFNKQIDVYKNLTSILTQVDLGQIKREHILSKFFIEVVYLRYQAAQSYADKINRGVIFTLNFEDDFGLLLRAFLESLLKDFEDKWEVKINSSVEKKRLRPDVGIYRKDNRLPLIINEIKNDLGYVGRTKKPKVKPWYSRFNERVDALTKKLNVPHDQIYFVVLTTENWLPKLKLKNWKTGVSDKILQEQKRKCTSLPKENVIFLCKEHPNAKELRTKAIFENLRDEYFCDFLEPTFLRIYETLSKQS